MPGKARVCTSGDYDLSSNEKGVIDISSIYNVIIAQRGSFEKKQAPRGRFEFKSLRKALICLTIDEKNQKTN